MHIVDSSTADLKLYGKIRSKKSVAARTSATKLCNCPRSEPGKVSIDPNDHLYGCRFLRRAWSSRYGTKMLVVPGKIRDGYSLGVVMREEA